VDRVDVWLGFAGVEKQLVVVAAALAARGVGAQGEASVAAQLHGGGVPAQVAGRLAWGAAGTRGQGHGEGQQGKGLGLGHDEGPLFHCRLWRNARRSQGWRSACDVSF